MELEFTRLPRAGRFFGLHKIRFRIKQKIKKEKVFYFVCMGNLFNTCVEIHERYDIKGSLYGRKTLNTYRSLMPWGGLLGEGRKHSLDFFFFPCDTKLKHEDTPQQVCI